MTDDSDIINSKLQKNDQRIHTNIELSVVKTVIMISTIPKNPFMPKSAAKSSHSDS